MPPHVKCYQPIPVNRGNTNFKRICLILVQMLLEHFSQQTGSNLCLWIMFTVAGWKDDRASKPSALDVHLSFTAAAIKAQVSPVYPHPCKQNNTAPLLPAIYTLYKEDHRSAMHVHLMPARIDDANERAAYLNVPLRPSSRTSLRSSKY